MAQVEHVPRPAPVAAEHVGDGGLDGRRRRQAHRRVEVALHGHVGRESGAADVQGHPPVDAHHVGAGLGEQAEQLAGAHAEVDAGHVEVGQPGEDATAGGQHRPPVVVGGQGPRPRVEDLHGDGTRCHLGPERREGDVGQSVEEASPHARVRVHEGLGTGLGLRRPALDQVAGQREGGAGEPDEGDVGLLGHQAHGVEDGGDVGLGLEGSEPAEVLRAAEGLIEHGPHALTQLDAHADGDEGDHDVGEEDGGVHTQATDRLHRDLGGQGRVARDVEHRRLGPYGPVLGQRPACLAHEPHRDPVHRPTPARVEKRAGGVGWHGRSTLPAVLRLSTGGTNRPPAFPGRSTYLGGR